MTAGLRQGLRRLAAALMLALPLAAAPASAQEPAVRAPTVYEDLQMFSQVLNQIRVNHPDTLDTHALFMAAVEGMIRAADPHSYVLPAARLSPEKQRALRDGELVRVPLEFEVVGGAAVVVARAPGTAAERLDILPGDELIAADGQPIVARSAPELDISLAGPAGTSVALLLERRLLDGSYARLTRVVVREQRARVSAIPVATMLTDQVGYVRLATFAADDVARDLRRAIDSLRGAGMKALVLDLRDNGGGLLDEAVGVLAAFLAPGDTVYTTEARKEDVSDTGVIRGRGPVWRGPIVVMLNRATASAAELVAAGLQDYDRALLVGEPTFGKALVMRGFPLLDGSWVMLTVGRLKTPCGRSVQRAYRDVSDRAYYRASLRERSTAGRPSCTTRGGRTVYGGAGVEPEVTIEREPSPLWASAVYNQDLPLRWAGGYITDRTDQLGDLEAFSQRGSLPADALQTFRAFAAEQGVEIPAGADTDRQLERRLRLAIASARWGYEGYALAAARTDPDVQRAVELVPRAAEMVPEMHRP